MSILKPDSVEPQGGAGVPDNSKKSSIGKYIFWGFVVIVALSVLINLFT